MTDKNWFDELVQIVAELRSEKGCSWDRKQTHKSLKRYLVEEVAEALDAIDDEDDESLADELGDVLLQIILHAQIATEQDRFDAQEVARRICEKLIRRHPHVFGDVTADSPEAVTVLWEQIKQQERQNKPSSDVNQGILHGVPRNLPALHRAYDIQNKAAKVGFIWPDVRGVLAKIDEELAEVREALASNDPEAIADEIGDLLFAVTNLSRFQGHFPEDRLHATIRKYERRFGYLENKLKEQGRTPEACSLEELESLWEQAKHEQSA
jgi:tetrapyrrole methylase family protein / MazG family protein